MFCIFDNWLEHIADCEIWQLFREIYPNEEFFPETSTSENAEDDDDIALDT